MRPGRKPLAEQHVESLSASALAKRRLEIILKSLRGQLTIEQASAQLGACQSRFFALRHQWLQESVELLEPRRVGRPPRLPAKADEELARLRAERDELARELQVADARREIGTILAGATQAPATEPVKKKKRRRNKAR